MQSSRIVEQWEAGVRRWLRSTAGGLPDTYWYLWSALLINRVGGFAILFMSLYLTGPRHLSPSLAGAVVGGYGVGGAAGALVGGVLADRWGRRRTLLLAHLAGAAAMLALAVVSSIPAIAALVVIVGIFQAMPSPAVVAAMVDVVPEHDRPRAFNLEFWALNLGMALAALVAGIVAQVSFTLLFSLDAATTLLAAGLILSMVPETLPVRGGRHVAAPAADGSARGLAAALGDRIFMVFVGLTLIQAILYMQSVTILPLAMKADHLQPFAYGLVTSLGAALIVIGQLFVPALIRGHRKGSVLAVASILVSVAYAVVAFSDVLPMYLLAATIWTGGNMLAAPPNASVIAELAPATLRARYQAVFYVTFSLAAFLAPALGGVSFQRLGSRHWLICAVVGVFGALGHLAASGVRERRVAAARPAESTEKWGAEVRRSDGG
ncbi:MAG: MFS transporter [Actinomycetota bacterium]